MTTAREYLRVSFDRSGRVRSITEQCDDNRRRWDGWDWGDPYSDAVSASRYSTRSRGGFAALLSDLRAGRFASDVLVLWEASRGSRQVSEWCALLDLCAEQGVRIAVTDHSRDYDPRTPRDRRSLQEDAVDSEYESGKISNRTRRAAAASAAAGGIPGGTVYGYRRLTVDGVKRLEIVPEQAAIIREIARRVLAGESQTAIALDLHARGVTGPRGGRVWQSTVHSWVTNHTIAGKRLHDAGSTGEGVVYPGTWEPILDERTWRKVRDRLGATRVGVYKSTRPTRYKYSTLLNGVIRCQDCPKGGSKYPMVTHNKRERRAGGEYVRSLYYVCRSCGRAVNAAAADEYVTARLLDRLAPLVDLRRPADSARRDQIEAELASIAQQRSDWGVALAEGRMSIETVTAAEAAVESRERALRATLRDLPAGDEDEFDADAIAVGWGGMSTQERREVVARFVPRVLVGPRGPGFRGTLNVAERVQVDGHGWEDGGRLDHAGAVLRDGWDRWQRAVERFRAEVTPGMGVRAEIELLEACLERP